MVAAEISFAGLSIDCYVEFSDWRDQSAII